MLKLEPLEKTLLDCDLIFQRVAGNPYLNQTYMQKIGIQLSKDIGTITELRRELIKNYQGDFSSIEPTELRK